MAVWGAPIATGGRRGARRPRRRSTWSPPCRRSGTRSARCELRARAGVLTGEAAVTLGAEGQGMVAGDLVNTASRDPVRRRARRRSSSARRRERATEASIAYEDAGDARAQGQGRAGASSGSALRVVCRRGGALQVDGLEAPFVGRDRELRLVKELFHASADERRAHLVSVTGIAGIGKSRLGWEFDKYIDGLARDVCWHRGRCLCVRRGRRRTGRSRRWSACAPASSRTRSPRPRGPSCARRSRSTSSTPRSGASSSRGSRTCSGSRRARLGDQEDLFAAWRLFFERLAERVPDGARLRGHAVGRRALLDFVEYLLEWSRNHPIFVLTLARPGAAERRPDLGRRPAQLHVALPRAALRSRRWRSC